MRHENERVRGGKGVARNQGWNSPKNILIKNTPCWSKSYKGKKMEVKIP